LHIEKKNQFAPNRHDATSKKESSQRVCIKVIFSTEANVILLLYNQWNVKNILKAESDLAIMNQCPE